jgi:lipoprotein-releasing system permease protein
MATAPFAPYEWMIAWRYLRAKRAEGGVSVMTWISLLGVTLAVFALIATLAVRSGFREEFVDTILGANAHVTVYRTPEIGPGGQEIRTIPDAANMADRIEQVPGVTRAAPLVRGQVMATFQGRNAGVEVFGIAPEDLAGIPRIASPEVFEGDIAQFPRHRHRLRRRARTGHRGGRPPPHHLARRRAHADGRLAPRLGLHRHLHLHRRAATTSTAPAPTCPLPAAQSFFNRDGVADEIEVMVEDPRRRGSARPRHPRGRRRPAPGLDLEGRLGRLPPGADGRGQRDVRDPVGLVLIASMNIISGLIMLVKNKGRDIGILRTMGLTEGSSCASSSFAARPSGRWARSFGVILGCAFALWIDPIFAVVNYVSGGGVWDPSIRGLYRLPAKLELGDVLSAVGLSLFLSWVVTLFPARRAARMNPVEALRYE